jgi:hypothetical protein
MKYSGTATPSARNVATPQAVACLFPRRSACENTARDAAAEMETTTRNWPKLSSYNYT